MLGDIQYNETGKVEHAHKIEKIVESNSKLISWLNIIDFFIWSGHIVSAGVTSLVLFGKMNVSEAHLNQKDRNVLGSQVMKCI